MMVRITVALSLIVFISAGLAGCGSAEPAGPPAPEALFYAAPQYGYAPEEVQFTDMSQGNVTSWEWDFNNDGIIDSTQQDPTHTYANPGNYTVNLSVAGAGGNDSVLKVEYLRFISCPNFADFVAEPTKMSGKHPIQFTDLTDVTGLSTGNVTSWSWDFNSDGIEDSTEQNPQYIYVRNGVYTVTLTVTTRECQDTLTKYEYIIVSGCSG